MEIIFVLIGLFIGFVLSYVFFKQQVKNTILDKDKQIAVLENSTNHLKSNILELNSELKLQIEKNVNQIENQKNIEIKYAALSTEYQNLQQRLIEHKEEVKQLQEGFKTEFKALAGDVLREQSNDFKDKNESVLQPFREQLKNFQEAVFKQMDENTKNATSFKLHIDSLKELNQKISQEAQNLTKALKGDSKQQGNWGELILEKILESSELEKGKEYQTQVSIEGEDEKRYQPDVIVYLPDNKHLIIDSKVSLVAYERLVNSESKDEQELALKEHLISIRTHIKNLADKKYHHGKGLTSPDFTLLFIPIESSFGVAIKEDVSLFNYAWDKKIVLVSPSTLLATLRTVASIWKQEKQNKNVLLIAEESGKLYDKMVGFLSDLESIENNFKKLGNQLEDSKKKLTEGKGNIISRIEKIKELGAKTNKQLSQNFKQNSSDLNINESEN